MADAAKQEPVITMWSKEFTYDRWMKSKGIPIHRGYFIEDLRTIELEWWEERGCKVGVYPAARARRRERVASHGGPSRKIAAAGEICPR